MTSSPLAVSDRVGAVLRQLLPYMAAAGLLIMLRQTRLSERANLLAYDLAMQLRPSPSGAETVVRLIGIDEGDLRHYGPMVPDGRLAAAIRTLDQLGVRAIGLDLFCAQPVGSGTAELRRLAATNPRLVSVYFEADGMAAIPGTPRHRQAAADLFTDPQDGVIRRDLLHSWDDPPGNTASLPMRLLQISKATETSAPPPAEWGQLVPGAGGYLHESRVSSHPYSLRMLAFHRPGSFPQWNLRTLLSQHPSAELRRQLRGSIVLIGVVARSSKDHFPVPFTPWRVGDRRFELPGVEIHAHRLASLLALEAGRPLGIQPAPPVLNQLALLMVVAAGIVAGEGVHGLRLSQLAVAFGVALLGVAFAGLLAFGLWLDGALPIAAFGLTAAAGLVRRGTHQELRGRQLEHDGHHVRSLLDRFVSREIAGELLSGDLTAGDAGQLRSVTVLMGDLRGFSQLSATRPAPVIVTVLNGYLQTLFEVIERFGGTVDEVQGDAVLVIFGAPQPRPDHADAAIACALAMQQAMDRVNRSNRLQQLPELEMGIGLCSGDVIAGTIGSSLRAKYTIVGTAINIVARIEAYSVGGEVLADASTIAACASPLQIEAEYLLTAKGAAAPVKIHAIRAIDGAYGIALPQQQATSHRLLRQAITYSLVQDKRRDSTVLPAILTKIGLREAWLELPSPHLQLFDELVFKLPGFEGDVYGKVRDIRDGSIRVVLSTLPDEIRVWLDCQERQ